MKLNNIQDNKVRGRRITVEEMAEILKRVNKTQGNLINNPTILNEYNKSPIEKKKKYFSKAAALGATERILSLVLINPNWGPTKLSNILMLEDISLTRQSVHKILAKHKLNLRKLRKIWVENQ